jgi:replicative DNA helicase
LSRELAVISAVVADRDTSTFFQANAEMFEAYGDVHSFIVDYYQQNRDLPPKRVIQDKFQIKLLDEIGSTKHHLEELRNLYVKRRVREILQSAAQKLQDGELASAVGIMVGATSSLKKDTTDFRDLDATDVDEAVAHLQRVKDLNAKGRYGVTFGIPGFDDFLPSGVVPGMFGLVLGFPGRGKPVTLDTPVLTPNGWTRNGNLKVDDYVIGSNGKPTKVIAVHPQGVLDSYRVTFNDGGSVLCGPDHDWTVQSPKMRLRNNGSWTVKTTKDLIGDLSGKPKAGNKKGAGYKWFVPVMEPVEHEEKYLPVEPYTLGVLIGDGCLLYKTATFCGNDPFIAEEIQRRNPDRTVNTLTPSGGAGRYSITPRFMGTVREIGLNVGGEEKYIPEEYMTASPQQRLDLLRGLMDSDGSVRPRRRARFHSCNKRLALDVQQLVWSLGGVAQFRSRDRGEGRSVEHEVTIWTPSNPFILPRKALSYDPRPWFRAIKSIQKVGVDKMQCITVDADDHLYVVKDYIVTHNSFLTTLMSVRAWQQDKRVLYVSLEMLESEVRSRFYSVVGEGKWSLRDLQRGAVDSEDFRTWAAQEFENRGEFPIVSNDGTGRFTPGTLRAKIEEYSPDIVFVDYLQLMAPDSGGDGNETVKLKTLSTELKLLAIGMRVPIIAVVSATPTDASNMNVIPELGQVAWSKQLAYDADWLIAVGRQDNSPIMGVAWRKNRNGPLTDFALDCDFDKGIFKYSELDFDDAVL